MTKIKPIYKVVLGELYLKGFCNLYNIPHKNGGPAQAKSLIGKLNDLSRGNITFNYIWNSYGHDTDCYIPSLVAEVLKVGKNARKQLEGIFLVTNETLSEFSLGSDYGIKDKTSLIYLPAEEKRFEELEVSANSKFSKVHYPITMPSPTDELLKKVDGLWDQFKTCLKEYSKEISIESHRVTSVRQLLF